MVPVSVNRRAMVSQLENPDNPWDIVVIGGGATGLGAAIDSLTRGYRTLLLEQHDFSKGTSSRSTKLVHGGVRYLAQGNIPLVIEALRERGRLRQNASHLVREQEFVIPCYAWWCIPFYTIGLTFYDLMAGKLGIGRSVPYSRKKTMEALPAIKTIGLRGGVRYYDCQFDDSRLAINMLQTVMDHGGTAVNYCRVTGILKESDMVGGIIAKDEETGKQYEIRSKAVINATGVFVDEVIKMDNPRAGAVVRPSQGIHLVVDRKFMDGDKALMIPRTGDGRVLFALPWHGRLVVGTTDVEKAAAELEPRAEPDEVEYILETAGRYLDPAPGKGDVLSVFAGLRPLAASTSNGQKTKEISRRHKIMVSESGLISITGGKWTTYRKMAEEVVDKAMRTARLPIRRSVTKSLKIHGSSEEIDPHDSYHWYGTDRKKLDKMMLGDPAMAQVLSDALGICKAQVIWAVREEMARTVEDFLSRRTRALFLDARESIRIAPMVAEMMAHELHHDKKWEMAQLKEFTEMAGSYLLPDPP
jgi:glycerol-3-phosphate dehydrogenase